MAKHLRRPGEFCWLNMVTPEPKKALEFYAPILNWQFETMPNLGYGILVDGSWIGAMFDIAGPNTPPGQKPVLGVMIKVENLEATAKKIKDHGGKAGDVMDIFDQGRMAVCHDPNGAQFDLWEPRKLQGTDVDAAVHGAPAWYETLTTDTQKATKFYTSVFGWKTQINKGAGFDYTSFQQGDTMVAGMMQIRPEHGTMKPHWGVYFSVTDVDAAAAKATKLGGTLCVQPMDIPGIGRFAGIVSPQGVAFYVAKFIPPGA